MDLLTLLILSTTIFLISFVYCQRRDYRDSQIAPWPIDIKWSEILIENQIVKFGRFGSGPTILMVHGIGASSFSFVGLAPLLAKDFEIILVDLPGSGQSPRGDAPLTLARICSSLEKLMDDLGIQNFHYLGSSLGGLAGLRLSQNLKDRIQSLVLLAPATDPTQVPSWVLRLRWALPLLSPLANRYIIRALMTQAKVAPQHLIKKYELNYLKPYLFNSSNLRALSEKLVILSDPELPERFSDISQKTLILWGQKDRLVSEKSIRNLQKTLPHSKLLIHPHAGHHPHGDESEWTATQIRSFLAQTKD